MKRAEEKTKKDAAWLLFFYSVPARPVSSRVKIWRRLAKAGAIQLKGAVYVLPYSERHYEFLQWLISEITAMKGDGAFVKARGLEGIKDSEIIELFNRQRERDYKGIEKRLVEIERQFNNIKKGGTAKKGKRLTELLSRIIKEFDGLRKIDFFSARAGRTLEAKIRGMKAEAKNLTGYTGKRAVSAVALVLRQAKDYQGRTWATRKRPYVDRMASAWLIKRFIDRDASFKFIDEEEIGHLNRDAAAFDIRGGEFTHQGDLCTFEALLKAFCIKDKGLKKIAEIVHELDMKDSKYTSNEAMGIEGIIIGITKTAKDDANALEKGMAIFEMLYASKT
ncbi:MAG: chromate resistance protein [Nitrospirae bacterium]|nr:chromate resistance protein [Nitrospirota bacterium]